MKKKKIIMAVAVILLCGAGFAAWHFFGKKTAASASQSADAKSPDKIYTVKRGNLVVGILLTGNVNTKRKYKLGLTVPFNTKLVAVVDENTEVKKGEIIARFETEDLQTRIDDLKIDLSNREKDLMIQKEELDILITTNKSDIRVAKDSQITAQDSYNKYRKLEGPRDKDDQSMKVSDALKAYMESKTAYNEAYNALNKPGGTVPKEDAKEKLEATLRSAEKAMQSAQVKYSSTILDRKIFKRYTYPSKIKDVKNKLDQTKLDLDKVMVRTTSSFAQKENTIFNMERNIRRVEKDLETLLYYMCNMQLVAPSDGFVIYKDPDAPWWGRNFEVTVGMDARRSQILITIPDMSELTVDINIPEQYRSKVRIGDSLTITPDSMPNIKIPGKISHIESIPVSLYATETLGAPKVYRAKVDFTTDNKDIVSGMNVQIEIISQTIKNIIYVPIESIFEEGGEFFVYRDTFSRPENVVVTLGTANDNFVEVLSGLEEGDEVYLYRPFQTSQKN